MVTVLHIKHEAETIAPACADRSGGPAMKPKPGDSYEMGPDGAGCRPWGAGEADGWPTGLTAVALEGPWTCRGVPAGDYMPRAALEGTHFFQPKTNMPPKLTYFFCFSVTRQTAICPIKFYRNFVQGVWSIRKVTVPLSKPIAMRHHR